ncbi:MAG: DUF3108 domain-containing protein [Caldimonas sp.]
MAALLMHLALLGGLDWAWPERVAAVSRAAPLRVRTVDTAVRPALQDAPREEAVAADASGFTAPGSAATLGSRSAQGAKPVQGPARAPTRIAVRVAEPRAKGAEKPVGSAPAAPAQRGPSSDESGADATVAATDRALQAERAPSEPYTEQPIPVYRTLIPPAATLRYALQRGSMRGDGELQWRPSAEGYSLRLAGNAGESGNAGAAARVESSRGAFDSAGLAPTRHVDEGARRAALATNFQREAGKISFSGSHAEFRWAPGSQDRLSWLIQLAAVLAADPGRRVPGALSILPVAGGRGESGAWVFRCVGPDAVETGAGPVAALKLVRASRGPYDPETAVWLDPARHYLPVRLLQSTGGAAPALELVLRELVLEP